MKGFTMRNFALLSLTLLAGSFLPAFAQDNSPILVPDTSGTRPFPPKNPKTTKRTRTTAPPAVHLQHPTIGNYSGNSPVIHDQGYTSMTVQVVLSTGGTQNPVQLPAKWILAINSTSALFTLDTDNNSTIKVTEGKTPTSATPSDLSWNNVQLTSATLTDKATGKLVSIYPVNGVPPAPGDVIYVNYCTSAVPAGGCTCKAASGPLACP
jgi:hypothetical protein